MCFFISPTEGDCGGRSVSEPTWQILAEAVTRRQSSRWRPWEHSVGRHGLWPRGSRRQSWRAGWACASEGRGAGQGALDGIGRPVRGNQKDLKVVRVPVLSGNFNKIEGSSTSSLSPPPTELLSQSCRGQLETEVPLWPLRSLRCPWDFISRVLGGWGQMVGVKDAIMNHVGQQVLNHGHTVKASAELDCDLNGLRWDPGNSYFNL